MTLKKIALATGLCLSLTTPAWSQSYNPTLSDLLSGNTAGGTGALLFGAGQNNTAFGRLALGLNQNGVANVAVGASALQANIIGRDNTAVGAAALRFNTSGGANIAVGNAALRKNRTGGNNVAYGVFALSENISGALNTALGGEALLKNTTGRENTGIGFQVLHNLSTGSRNIAIGFAAGLNVLTGLNNIHIGNRGKEESNTIRIGDLQTKTFIAGIRTVPINGVPVVINPQTGQLGVAISPATLGAESVVIDQLVADLQALRQEVAELKAQLGQ